MIDVNEKWFTTSGCHRTIAELKGEPRHALDTANEFRGLQWWLRPEVLHLARGECRKEGESTDGRDEMWSEPLPPLPRFSGSCWIVLANEMRGFPLLRDALVLPLRWVAGKEPEPPSPFLPELLKAEADSVLLALGKSDPIPDRHWRLEPCFVGKGESRDALDARIKPLSSRYNFGEFEIDTWESCWASLAAGLLVAMRGGKVKPEVWASARWVKDHLDAVSPTTLHKKLGLAVDWGAEMFFLHHSGGRDSNTNVAEDIKQKKGWKLEIKPLGLAQRDPDDPNEPPAETELRPLLRALEVPPNKYDPIEARSTHFLSFANDNEADDYYYRQIIETIAEDCRAKLLAKGHGPVLAGSRLITILSKSPVALLGAMTVQPREWLVFHTRGDHEIDENLDRIMKRAGTIAPHPVALRVLSFERSGDYMEEFSQSIEEFLGPGTGTPPIVDATSGTQLMNINLMLCSPHGSWFLVIDSEISPRRRRVIPHTAEPYLMQKD